MEECQEKCLSYKECFLFSTIALVSDVVNMEETLATRGEHEEVTASIEKFIRSQETDCMALSTESCDICEHCAYPVAPLQISREDAPLSGKPWDHCKRAGRKIFYGFCLKSYGNPLVQSDLSEVIFSGDLSYAVIRTIRGRQID